VRGQINASSMRGQMSISSALIIIPSWPPRRVYSSTVNSDLASVDRGALQSKGLFVLTVSQGFIDSELINVMFGLLAAYPIARDRWRASGSSG